ncbi:MAG: NAD(P)H-quinone oxidoreductase [Gemmatimonadota bacterium]
MARKMRAVVIARPGGPEVLEMREVPVPILAPGEVLVRVAASGVNRADLLQRMGRYPPPPGFPEDIPGLEFAGVAEEVRGDVGPWEVGAAVMGITGGGGYAEYVAVPAATLVPVPPSLDLVRAGAVPEVFQTAFDAVFLQAGLQEGETLLIHAVGSGVGTAALQLAQAAGARVVGTSRTAEKLRRAEELGLSEAILAEPGKPEVPVRPGGAGASPEARKEVPPWAAEVLRRTDGRGADVILDLVGGPYLTGNQRVLARRGRHMVVGVPGGPRAVIDLRALMSARGSITGTVLRARPVEEKAELARAFRDRVLPLFDRGALEPVIDRILPAAEAADAHRALEANETFGKIVLTW